LGLVSDDLAMSDDPGAATAAERVEAALNKTQRSGADLTLLADQLDALSTVAALPLVAGLLDGRGEQGLAARLSSLAAALRQGAQDAPRLKGAHTESEQINLLDGLLILKLRRIRDIARRIARKRAQPALANDFSFAYL
jgi:hypothetical protein